MQQNIVKSMRTVEMNVPKRTTIRNPKDKVNHAVNVSAATINKSNKVISFLQIVPVSVHD